MIDACMSHALAECFEAAFSRHVLQCLHAHLGAPVLQMLAAVKALQQVNAALQHALALST